MSKDKTIDPTQNDAAQTTDSTTGEHYATKKPHIVTDKPKPNRLFFGIFRSVPLTGGPEIRRVLFCAIAVLLQKRTDPNLKVPSKAPSLRSHP